MLIGATADMAFHKLGLREEASPSKTATEVTQEMANIGKEMALQVFKEFPEKENFEVVCRNIDNHFTDTVDLIEHGLFGGEPCSKQDLRELAVHCAVNSGFAMQAYAHSKNAPWQEDPAVQRAVELSSSDKNFLIDKVNKCLDYTTGQVILSRLHLLEDVQEDSENLCRTMLQSFHKQNN